MAASSSDLSNRDAAAAMRREQSKRGPPVKFLMPLIYAPVLPLIRIGLRRNPVLRDRLFTAVLAGGFLHGFYLVFDDWNASKSLTNAIFWSNVWCSLICLTDLYDIESK